MNNPDLYRPVRLEHVEQPLANRLFLLWRRHLREVAGVQVCELVPGGSDNAPPISRPATENNSQDKDARGFGEKGGENGRVAISLHFFV